VAFGQIHMRRINGHDQVRTLLASCEKAAA